MIVHAIDPGNEQSALVLFDGCRVVSHETIPNASLVARLGRASDRIEPRILVIEQIASFGMPVGAEVFETVFWSGRFAQAWLGEWTRIKRHEVKTSLCGNMRAKDANIRQVLLDRFGPGREKAMGTKKAPGPLYGVTGDQWAALAVAVTWFQINRAMPFQVPLTAVRLQERAPRLVP